ncbi:MAG TPA: helix-turn-helix domain-containing protein [Candidatus Dormibacteraeota bacterium]|nr:helix-turn-helix domain-containing protein [Candidatus Dormibacteraeota bacterium]
MATRGYRLGRRQAAVDRTRAAILSAARQLVAEVGPEAGVGKVAERAGVSRITVYNQFGSKAGLLEALTVEAGLPAGAAPAPASGTDSVDDLKRRIAEACTAWAADPRLYRQLQGRSGSQDEATDRDRDLAERLAADDRLRPGCSIKEAEDVIGILTSFPVFDRLHKSGRRSPAAVAEILVRMASAFMGERSPV